ncbi:glycosyltransferase family 39 protein [Streptomyces sp. 8N706]|uniref:glycosyltransferase family 39 protein n=1 Tax=Streptomyces sp. 8N706 TaxID=3457416 RepID=UPI003FD6AFE0
MVTTEMRIPLRPVSLTRRTPVATWLIPAVTMAALGLWDLNLRGMWGDEAATWTAARRTPAELWHLLQNLDAVHGLYYLLMHVVLELRADEVMLRLPSVLAMSCAAAVVAGIGARLAGPRVGLMAGMLFAVVPVVSLYAQEGRSYALVVAGAVTATYLLVRGCASGNPRWWLLYALVTAVTVLLHAFVLLLLAAHAVVLLAARSTARTWRYWGVSAAVTVVVLAPVLWMARDQTEAISWITEPGWDAVVRLVRSFSGPSGWIACVTLLLAAAALFLPRRPAFGVSPLSLGTVALPLLLVPPALLIAVSQVYPLYDVRYVLYALPGLSLLVAAGIDRLSARVPWRGAMPLAGALVVSLVLGGQVEAQRHVRSAESRRDDLRPIAQLVRDEARPGDAVVFLAGTRRKAAISYPQAFAGLRDIALEASPAKSGTLFGTELPPARVRELLSRADRVWLLDREDSDQRRVFRGAVERVKQDVLSDQFHREGVERLHGGSVHLFVHD